MRRSAGIVLALGLAAWGVPAIASAQVVLGAAAGVTFPTSDYGDYAKTGWLGHVDVGVPVGENGLQVGVSGYFGSNSHDDTVTGVSAGDKTNLYGALGWVGFTFGGADAPVSPTIWGMAGSMTHSFKSDANPIDEGSETGFAYGGGVGLGFPLGSIVGVVRGWYLAASMGDPSSTTAIIGLDAGVQIPLGGGM